MLPFIRAPCSSEAYFRSLFLEFHGYVMHVDDAHVKDHHMIRGAHI